MPTGLFRWPNGRLLSHHAVQLQQPLLGRQEFASCRGLVTSGRVPRESHLAPGTTGAVPYLFFLSALEGVLHKRNKKQENLPAQSLVHRSRIRPKGLMGKWPVSPPGPGGAGQLRGEGLLLAT